MFSEINSVSIAPSEISISPVQNNTVDRVATSILSAPSVTTATSLLERVHQYADSFTSVTRYLPGCKELLKSGSAAKALCRRLEISDWRGINVAYAENLEALPVDALNAFHKEWINKEQFSTLVFFWSLLKQFPDTEIQIYPLFKSDDSLSVKAKELILQTLRPSGVAEGEKPFLNKKQFGSFISKMREQPESERVFFLIGTKRYGNKGFDQRADTVTEQIHTVTGLNVFHHVQCDDISYRMITSFSMMQQFLNVYAEEAAITITPVIGLSSLEDIVNNGKTDTRDMALPFPNVVLPKEADSFAAPYDLDFVYHDFYHSILASSVPILYRRAFMAYSDILLTLKNEYEDPYVLGFLDKLYERIIDMEYPAFRKNGLEGTPFENPTDGHKFLWALSYEQGNALNKLIMELGSQDTLSVIESSLKIGYALREHEVIARIAKKLNEVSFCAEYRISPEELSLLVEYSNTAKTQSLDDFQAALVDAPEIELGGETMPMLEAIQRSVEAIDKNDLPRHLLASFK